MNITLILRNGQRIPIPAVLKQHPATLLCFGIVGYIVKPDSLDVTKLR